MDCVRYVLLVFCLIIILSNSVNADPTYVLVGNRTWDNNLTGIPIDPAIAFGDIDNDGDLDLLAIGCANGDVDISCDTFEKTRVYINNGTTLQENTTWQQNLSSSFESLALGDIDNDGDLDLIIANIQKVYINNGTTFTENSTWQQELVTYEPTPGSVGLGDIDNDGDLDLAFTGFSSNDPSVYINNGTTFIGGYWIDSSLRDTRESVHLIDIDNDNDLDLVSAGNEYGALYINNGTGFTAVDSSVTSMDHVFSVAGDLDNDGDIDLIEMGLATGCATRGLRNDGTTLIRNTLWEISGLARGSFAVGDYDNDGDLDLIAIGRCSSNNYVDIYDNNGTTFIDNSTTGANLSATYSTSTAWIDIDMDNDLDLAIVYSGVIWIYINNITTPNTAPYTPNVTNSSYNEGSITLNWGNASDAETPTPGLYYNLRVGSASGGNDIVSGVYGGMSNPTAGYFGNMMQRKALPLKITRLQENQIYYWSVQSIDTALKASDWSTEQNFTITDFTEPIITVNAPDNGYSTPNRTVVFNVTVYDNVNLTNVSLYGNWSGWHLNETNSSGVNNTDYIFTKDLATYGDGTFSWFIRAYDNNTNYADSGNRTFTIGDMDIGLIENVTWEQNLTQVKWCSAIWGDVNNNGKLDLALFGYLNDGIGKIYINNGTTLQENTTWQGNITPLNTYGTSFGDIDNDGDLDLVNPDYQNPKIYINNGTTLQENTTWEQNLTGLQGSAVLGDIDNDGDLDLVSVGEADDNDLHSKIYINNGTTLQENTTWQQNLIYIDTELGGSLRAMLGDIDNDGDLDLLIIGYSSAYYSKVYINNGTTLIENADWQKNLINITPHDSVALGDIDNDGDLDLALSGQDSDSVRRSKIYINNKSSFVENQTWQENITGLSSPSIAWGDYDNDGDFDLITTGWDGESSHNNFFVAIYENNGTSLVRSSTAAANITAVSGSVAWSDINSDDVLDLILLGDSTRNQAGGETTKIYINNATTSNTAPYTPNVTNSSYKEGSITLNWSNASDTETPTLGLYYNLRVGTTSGGNDIVSGVYGGMSNPTAGYFGNMMQRKSLPLKVSRLQENQVYYWSVQSIDTALKASSWSTEQNFTITDFTEPVITVNAPDNGYSTPNRTIVFNVTVQDNVNLTNVSLYGNWGSWHLNETNESTGQNNTNFIFTKDLATYGDGTFSWFIRAYDNNTNYADSGNRTFAIDTTAPYISLELPLNWTWNSSNTTMFYYVPNETTSAINNTVLWTNTTGTWRVNMTNQSAVTNGTANSFTLTGIPDGSYIWGINITDRAGNWRFSEDKSFYVDTIFNSVSVSAPANGTYDNDGTFDVTFLPNDTNAITNCSVYINNSYIKSNTSAITNDTGNTIQITGQPDGLYIVSVNCSDIAGSHKFTEDRSIVVDSTFNSLTTDTPANSTWDSDGTVDFAFTPTDTNLITNCSLYANFSGTFEYVMSNTSAITNGSSNTIQKSSISDGSYIWNVNCTDIAENHKFGEDKSIYIDTIAPQVSTPLPANGTWFTTPAVNFNVTVNDTNSIVNGSLFINISGGSYTWNMSNASTIYNNTVFNFTLAGIPDGSYLWNANFTDIAENHGWGEDKVFYVDTTTPIIKVYQPQNTTYSNSSVPMSYSIDELNLNSTIIWQYNGNGTNYTTSDNSSGIYLGADGTKILEAWNNDSAGNIGYNITYLTRDTTKPTINLISPTNSSTWTTSSTVTFTYNVSDITPLNCTLYVSDISQASSTYKSPNAQLTFTKSLSNGNYNYSINCTDSGNNTNSSLTYKLTVSYTAPSTTTTTGTGGSSGGSLTATIPKEILIIGNLDALTTVTKTTEEKSPITQVSITPNTDAQNVQLIIKQLSAKPDNTQEPDYTAYNYINITPLNINDTTIKNAKIRFKVNRSWVVNNNVDMDKVYLLRYKNNKWERLNTNRKSSTSTVVFYEATTPGFSTFAITGEKKTLTEQTTEEVNVTNITENVTDKIQTNITDITDYAEENGHDYRAIVLVLFVLVVGYLVYRKV